MRLFHPLAGARFAVLVGMLRRYGGVSATALPAVAIMLASCGLRYVSCELETRRAARLVREHPQSPDPLFIVGHWRSGTTLLANLLSLNGGFCYPTLVEAVSPHDFFPSPVERLTRRALPLMFPKYRPMDQAKVPMRGDFPQEDEMAMAALGAPSFYNALYFPNSVRQIIAREVFLDDVSGEAIADWSDRLAAYIQKLSLLHPGKRPLLKNPAHSARLNRLPAIFPDARYVLIRRDPDAVRASMRRLFEHLWPLLALQRHDLSEVPAIVDELYAAMDGRLERDWPQIPADQRLELAYRDLVADPVDVVRDLQTWLGEPATDAQVAAMSAYLRDHEARPNDG